MSRRAGESPLWNRVLEMSEIMEDPLVSTRQIRDLLSGLEVGFADTFDPAENFPEFAAHRLCRSLGRLLERLEMLDAV